jgi:hypothetical protein
MENKIKKDVGTVNKWKGKDIDLNLVQVNVDGEVLEEVVLLWSTINTTYGTLAVDTYSSWFDSGVLDTVPLGRSILLPVTLLLNPNTLSIDVSSGDTLKLVRQLPEDSENWETFLKSLYIEVLQHFHNTLHAKIVEGIMENITMLDVEVVNRYTYTQVREVLQMSQSAADYFGYGLNGVTVT